MRLSTKGRYAVMAMADLARRQSPSERGLSLADIAERQDISLSYLEQLFARLRRKGLVVSARGPGGGYRLSRAAAAISVAEIILAVDEPLHATRCGAMSHEGCMSKGERCLTHALWDDLGRHIESFLTSVSLDDVACGRLGAQREAAA